MIEAMYMVVSLALTIGLVFIIAKTILKLVGNDDEQD